jgi:hypothetical protein
MSFEDPAPPEPKRRRRPAKTQKTPPSPMFDEKQTAASIESAPVTNGAAPEQTVVEQTPASSPTREFHLADSE